MTSTSTIDATEIGEVYLLHLDPPYKHARHYIGWARNLDARLRHHERGTGANLCRVAMQAGSRLVLTRTWKADRNFERKLKRSKNAPLLCPVCNPKAMNRAN